VPNSLSSNPGSPYKTANISGRGKGMEQTAGNCVLKNLALRSMFVVAICPCAIASTFDKLRILFSQLPLTVAEKE
jgi:hypothetical protein